MLPSAQDLATAGYANYIASLQQQGYSAADALLQAAAKQAVDEVHALAVTLAAARTQHNDTAVTELTTQLQYWQQQLAEANAAVNHEEAPSALAIAVSGFSDDALGVLQNAGVGVENTLTGLGGLLKNLPLLLGLAVLVAIGYAIWKYRLLERPA